MTIQKLFEALKASSRDHLTVISIPLSSDLMDIGRDFFPPYFRGWCASTIHETPETFEVNELELDEVYEELIADIWFSRVSFMIENCSLETVEQFAREYEARTKCRPGDPNELIVFKISLKPETSLSSEGITTAVLPAPPKLSSLIRTSA